MAEPYNIKLIEYENGTFCIKVYSECINADYECSEEILSHSIPYKPKKMHHKVNRGEDLECPFDGEIYKVYTPLEIQQINRSSVVSRKRTLDNIYKYSRQAVWEYFITLTFDSEKVNRYDFSEVMKKSKRWFNNQQQRFAPDLKFLYVPEMHKDGAFHIHGLIADCGNMKITDSGRVSIGGKAFKRTESNCSYPTIYNLSGWNFGWSTATYVSDTKRVSSYITKYITKELCEVSKNKRRFYRSRNLTEPKEITFVVEGDKNEFIQKIIDSIGLDLSYEKVVSSDFNTVTYKYYEEKRT